MATTAASAAYRQISSQGMSPVTTLLALYDILYRDLGRAADAMHRGEIEERCRHLKHGFSVLTQLDALLDIEGGGRAAENLRRFYGSLRQHMLQAQFQLRPALLEAASDQLLEVRGAWEQVQRREQASATPSPLPLPMAVEASPQAQPFSFEA